MLLWPSHNDLEQFFLYHLSSYNNSSYFELTGVGFYSSYIIHQDVKLAGNNLYLLSRHDVALCWGGFKDKLTNFRTDKVQQSLSHQYSFKHVMGFKMIFLIEQFFLLHHNSWIELTPHCISRIQEAFYLLGQFFKPTSNNLLLHKIGHWWSGFMKSG